jgi:hypothetical protein
MRALSMAMPAVAACVPSIGVLRADRSGRSGESLPRRPARGRNAAAMRGPVERSGVAPLAAKVYITT